MQADQIPVCTRKLDVMGIDLSITSVKGSFIFQAKQPLYLKYRN